MPSSREMRVDPMLKPSHEWGQFAVRSQAFLIGMLVLALESACPITEWSPPPP